MNKWFLLISITLMANIGTIQASSLLTAKEISTSNIMSATNRSISDGLWFEEMSYKMMTGSNSNMTLYANTIWWNNMSGEILIDLGSSFNIQDVVIQVDSDDTYKLDYSIDNNNWENLFTITPEDGEIPYRMDSMSSDLLSSEYVANMDFFAVKAQYLRLSASGEGGVNRQYFLSELQAFGTPINEPNILNSAFIIEIETVSVVPAPPSLMLFSAGLIMLAGLQYRRKKLTSNV